MDEQAETEEGRAVLPESGAAEKDRLHTEQMGTSWLALVRQVAVLRQNGYVVKSVALRGNWSGMVDLLVVITADGPDGPVVAFHGGESIGSIWRRLARRMENGGLVWKEDRYG